MLPILASQLVLIYFQLEEQKILRRQITELKSLLDNHALSQHQQEIALKQQFESSLRNALEEKLPALEGAVTNMKRSADIYNNHLNGSVSYLTNTYNIVLAKIMSLEKMISVLDSNDKVHNDIHKNIIDPHLRGAANSSISVDTDAVVNAVLKIINSGEKSAPNAGVSPASSSLAPVSSAIEPSVAVVEGQRVLLGADSVLLIIASNRPEYLQRSLNYIAKFYPR